MSEVFLALEERVQRIEIELTGIKKLIVQAKNGLPISAPAQPPAPVVALPPALSEFEELRGLLQSSDWPPAINPGLICDISSEQDKQDRAEGILDIIIDMHLEGLKMLDFGCGEGHVVSRSTNQNPELAVGYDILESTRWSDLSNEKTLFTSNWTDVVKNGPYSVILMYDVIDHIVNEDPIELLKRLRPLLKPNGKVYVRCHPWCSRHATHLYHDLNKAYAHLVFSEQELQNLGHFGGQKVKRVIHPILSYNDMFVQSGFRLSAQPQIMREPIEPFFVNTPVVTNRIKANWKDSHEQHLRDGSGFPFIQMEQQFLDYILL